MTREVNSKVHNTRVFFFYDDNTFSSDWNDKYKTNGGMNKHIKWYHIDKRL